MSNNYTGHGAKTGGLQQHSIGDLYPYTVMAVGHGPTKLMYCAFDCRSGSTGRERHTYAEAERDIHTARIRNMMHS